MHADSRVFDTAPVRHGHVCREVARHESPYRGGALVTQRRAFAARKQRRPPTAAVTDWAAADEEDSAVQLLQLRPDLEVDLPIGEAEPAQLRPRHHAVLTRDAIPMVTFPRYAWLSHPEPAVRPLADLHP